MCLPASTPGMGGGEGAMRDFFKNYFDSTWLPFFVFVIFLCSFFIFHSILPLSVSQFNFGTGVLVHDIVLPLASWSVIAALFLAAVAFFAIFIVSLYRFAQKKFRKAITNFLTFFLVYSFQGAALPAGFIGQP
jgi:hypothetical protein